MSLFKHFSNFFPPWIRFFKKLVLLFLNYCCIFLFTSEINKQINEVSLKTIEKTSEQTTKTKIKWEKKKKRKETTAIINVFWCRCSLCFWNPLEMYSNYLSTVKCKKKNKMRNKKNAATTAFWLYKIKEEKEDERF